MLGTELPILPIQALWINMTTAVLLGLTLAFEPKETTLMQRPPRDPNERLVDHELIMRSGLLGLLLLAGAFGLFWWMLSVRESTPSEARTVAVNVFIVGSIAYLYNCRSLTRSNRSNRLVFESMVAGGRRVDAAFANGICVCAVYESSIPYRAGRCCIVVCCCRGGSEHLRYRGAREVPAFPECFSRVILDSPRRSAGEAWLRVVERLVGQQGDVRFAFSGKCYRPLMEPRPRW